MSLIIDPTTMLRGADDATAGTLAPRPHSLSGLRLGLFENTKRNAAEFLDVLGERFEAHDEVHLVRRTKHQFGLPMTDELGAELKENCDVVVVGVGDCGSCSATAITDGIALEKKGVPAVVIVTEAFEATAKAIAGIEGSPDYDFLMIPHPFANLSATEMADLSTEIESAIRDRLTDKSFATSTV